MKNKPNFIKKISRIWVAISLLLAAIIIIFLTAPRRHDEDLTPQACGGTWCFEVELARTQAEQQKGLMYRESLPEGNGMLFIFDTYDFHNFRMKNTLIPLDMIWIDDQNTVVRIITAQPCTTEPCEVYTPEALSKYVLEINAGMAQKRGISEGTKIRLRNIY